MKQIEITVKVNESFEAASQKLKNQGFKIIRESEVNDINITSKVEVFNIKNIQYILKNSVLLRHLKLNDKEIKKITYKNKEYDLKR